LYCTFYEIEDIANDKYKNNMEDEESLSEVQAGLVLNRKGIWKFWGIMISIKCYRND
jgi:hypothetical protein